MRISATHQTPAEILSGVQLYWLARNAEAERRNRAGELQCLANATQIGSVREWPESGRRWRTVEKLGTHDGPYYSGLYAHWFRCEEVTQ